MKRSVAITCAGVSKAFALVEAKSAWRLVMGARFSVPSFEALKDISLEVPKGQFVGVLGRNGAGKSTLLRVIGGVYTADRGRIAVNGALSGLYELGLAANPELTAREYGDRLLTVHGFSKRERAILIDDILDFSELGDRFDDPLVTYSAGMTARLFFSTATAGSYEVYLLDEILSVGDQHFQAKCWRRLRDRVSRGASGVLVTHDWSAIVRMCETAHILEKGRVAFSGPAVQTVRKYLYGDSSRQEFKAGIAKFLTRPHGPVLVRAGEDLRIPFRIEVLKPATVSCVCAFERLQPGFGWETELLTRSATPVAREPGRYDVEVSVPRMPLEAGVHQLAIHLVMPDPELTGRLVLLDGYTWLNGDGIIIEVAGKPEGGLHLPIRWRVSVPEPVPA